MNNLLFIIIIIFSSCDWHGTQELFAEHAKSTHPHLQEHLHYWHSGTVPFSFRQTIRMIKLIDAFNRAFVFYYNSNGDSEHLTFAIFMIGRKSDADKYLIDFEIRKDDRKIKFLEQCFTDTDDIIDEIQSGRGFTIQKRVIESFIDNDKINFRYIIKRKEVVKSENVLKEEYSKKNLLLRGGNGSNGGDKIQQNVDDSKPNVMNDIKAIWNDNIQPTNAATPIHQQQQQHQHQQRQQFSNKGVSKPNEHSPRDYMVELSREFEPNILAADEATTVQSSNSTYNGRPQKMDMSALTDIVQSLNLRRGTGGNEYNNNNQSNNSQNTVCINHKQFCFSFSFLAFFFYINCFGFLSCFSFNFTVQPQIWR